MRALVVIVLGGLAGCFSPTYRDGLRCSDLGTCPPGQRCFDDGRCHASPPDLAVADGATGPLCPPVAGLAGAAEGQFCGDNQITNGVAGTVYLCSVASANGPPLRAFACPLGCSKQAAGKDDYCNPGNCAAGVIPGDYCGNDTLDGDPGALFSCAAAGQPPSYKQFCLNGCKKEAAGTSDHCM